MQQPNNHKSLTPIPPPLNQRYRRGLLYKKLKNQIYLWPGTFILFILLYISGMAEASPIPDIKVNGSDNTVYVGLNDNISMSISLNADLSSGIDADWWIAGHTPTGWQYFDIISGDISWKSDLSVSWQGPLFNFSTFDIPLSNLPEGINTFYFVVDMGMNGALGQEDPLFYDAVTINIAAQSRVQPANFKYLGAFRLPGEDVPPRTFAYGGNAMTFNPDGDLSNTDKYTGSLFVMGHDRIAYGALPDGNQVAEIAIPVPGKAKNPKDLPSAAFLQDFKNVTQGFFTDLEEIPKVGMQYLNHPATGPKIHLTWGQHLQPPDIASQAWFNPDLDTPNFQGVWFIGNQNLYSVNGYLFDIPTEWADTHTQGRYLATGRMRDGGQGGMGPALFAYRPWQDDGSAPASGTHLTETPLLLYENVYNTDQNIRCLDGYQAPDEWEGGAWITTSSGKSALLFAGTKSNGTKYWYGYIHPDGAQYPCVDSHVTDFTTCRMADGSPCPDADFLGCCNEEDENCMTYRGWWSTHMDAQFILYDPLDIAKVAAGTMESWEPQPYAAIDIDEYMYDNPAQIDLINSGSGEQRRYRIGATAYDRNNGFLYVLELFADQAKPVVHVWQIE